MIRERSKHNGGQLVTRVNEAVAMSTQKPVQPQIYVNVVNFDTDSNTIGLDNRCTACISNRIEDFDGPVTKTDRTIRAFAGGRVANVYTGTIVWKWLDDEVKQYKFRIPQSYFVFDGGCRLLSPQHWAKSQCRIEKGESNFGETTLQDKSILFWGDNKLTIPLGRDDNVATFRTAPGFGKYGLLCQKCEISEDEEMAHPFIINDTQIQEIEDDDAQISWMKAPNTRLWSEESGLPIGIRQALKKRDERVRKNTQVRMNLKGVSQTNNEILIEEQSESVEQSKSAELLMYHTRM